MGHKGAISKRQIRSALLRETKWLVLSLNEAVSAHLHLQYPSNGRLAGNPEGSPWTVYLPLDRQELVRCGFSVMALPIAFFER